MSKKKILIIDDESTLQHLLKNLLEKEGYETLSAANGLEGFSLLKKQHVDLIILDILMPIMDGFTFYKKLKVDMVLQRVPVLVLTIRKKMEDTFISMGAKAFLEKPFNRQNLLFEIKTILACDSLEVTDSVESKANRELMQAKLEGADFKNILVAGTVDNVTSFMAENLKGQGYRVEVANSSNEVIVKVHQSKPDVILMEINMDGLTAEDVVNEIKKTPTMHTQILLYSYFLSDEKEKNSIERMYYSDFFEQNPQSENHENLPVYYLGAFHQRSFIHKIKRFLLSPS